MSEWNTTCTQCGERFEGTPDDVEGQLIDHYTETHAELMPNE